MNRAWSRTFVPALLAVAVLVMTLPAAYAFTFPNPTQDVGDIDALALGDFNGDGVPDAVIVQGLQNRLELLLGSGTGAFGPPAELQTDVRLSRVVAADFNHDGRTDLAALRYDYPWPNFSYVNLVELLLSRGDGTFGTPQLISVPRGHDLVAADADGDGTLDLIVLTTPDGSGQVCVLRNSGSGTLSPPACRATSSNGFDLAVADFNEDGRADAVVAGTNGLYVHFGTASGLPASPITVGPIAYLCAAGDVNGDGHADLIYQPSSGGPTPIVIVLLGDGAGAFAAGGTFSVLSCCSDLGVADVDQDGIGDVVIAGNNYDGAPWNGFTVVTRPDLGGTMRVFSSEARISALSGQDLNADGRLDVIAGVLGGLTSFMGTGDRSFGEVSLGSGAGHDIASADLNGDGHRDLVVTETANDRLAILLSHGDGTFAAPLRFPCGHLPQGLALADFNGDGWIDVATGLTSDVAPAQTSGLAVLLGRGDGTLDAPILRSGGETHTRVVQGDFNEDGRVDLASDNSINANISVFIGTGDGHFGPHTRFPTGLGPNGLVTGDVDGDGHLDLVVASSPYDPIDPQGTRQTPKLTILHGLGNGDFEAPRFVDDFPMSTESHLILADLNGDGIPDIAGASDLRNEVRVFLGLGLGAFAPPLLLPVGYPPVTIAAGDFDMDGRLDLLTGTAYSDLDLMAGDGTGHFAPPRRFGIAQAADLLVEDFNGDGVPDVALANPDALASLMLSGPGSQHPPVAQAGPDRTVECAPASGTPVLLDGSQSSDPDNDIVNYTWFEDFGTPSERVLGTGRKLTAPLALGSHAVTLRVTDSLGAATGDTAVIDVVDTLPPDLTITLSAATLWPPNHRMLPVTSQVVAIDRCAGPSNVSFQGIVSSEPDDAAGPEDGNNPGDIAVADPDGGSFALRAERSSLGSGRVYTVSYAASDPSGHEAVTTRTIEVPHDIGGVTDPIDLRVSIAAGGDALVEWAPIAGVSHFDVAAGLLSTLVHLDPGAGAFPPSCIADQVPPWITTFQIGGDPDPGTGFFFLVDYVSFTDATAGPSGYGTENGPFDLDPVVPADICP